MKIDVEVASSPAEVPGLARKAEEMGFDCFWVNETKHDAFVQLALAAAGTKRIGVGSSIALAFTRSPTTIAYAAWDLQRLAGGRLLLGLGSQVKGHIERRFGMKWESPASKMKDTVLAVRAVWKSWQEGVPLRHDGRFYKLDLMTPFFSPGAMEWPKIPVYLATVNEGMARVAGQVADGAHVHPLHTVKYLREVLRPALDEGMKKSGRKGEDVTVTASVFSAVGKDRREVVASREACRGQIAFYASTRTYRKVMEAHGWGDVCDRLHELSVRGEWDKMPGEVSDDVLAEMVVEGTWDKIGRLLVEKYRGLVDRVRLYTPFDGGDDWKALAVTARS
ncbi:MAG: TIGR03617 family F420-dependent LLM class oxidoreductase [archaeon]|nr:MAG: TIGR03617 family F420-dependent LLM class oxidoreductase [archaeon]